MHVHLAHEPEQAQPVNNEDGAEGQHQGKDVDGKSDAVEFRAAVYEVPHQYRGQPSRCAEDTQQDQPDSLPAGIRFLGARRFLGASR